MCAWNGEMGLGSVDSLNCLDSVDQVGPGQPVSIVLPVQADAAVLARTVQAVLAQTLPHWQLVLVTDAATERAACVEAQSWAARDPRIEVLVQPGVGRAGALRAGLRQVRGAYTVLHDAAHAWAPDFLALTTAFLEGHPLEDLVCMEATTPRGVPTRMRRPDLFREQAPLRQVLDVAGVPAEAVWRQGELARHLRWGEYTHLAVTLLRTELAEWLVPALLEESEALDYRLQARLASRCAVNLLALPGAVHHPRPCSTAQQLQQASDLLAVFDEIHGRQWETDPEVARLRRAHLAAATPQPRWSVRAWLGVLGGAARPASGVALMPSAQELGRP